MTARGTPGPHNRGNPADPDRVRQLAELERAGLLNGGWAKSVLIDRHGALDPTVSRRLLDDLAASKLDRHTAKARRRRARQH